MAKHSDLTSIHPAAYVASSDPGAVGAHKMWVDTSSGPPYQLKKRNAANSSWETVGLSASSAAPTNATYVVGAADGGLSAELVLGTAVIMEGVFASRPAAATAGRLYYATDTKTLYRDTGVGWTTVGYVSPLTTQGDILYGGASGLPTRLAAGSLGQRFTLRGGTIAPAWEDEFVSLNFMIDGGGSAITTGIKGNVRVDYDCQIAQVTMLADVVGSIVVDIWKCTYAQYDGGATHPVAGDSITASAKPTISGSTKSQDSTLTGWTTTLSAGDILRFNVDSIATITNVTLDLKLKRT